MMLSAAALLLIPAFAAGAKARYAVGRRRADEAWRHTHVEPIEGVGATRSLGILPLVDWGVVGGLHHPVPRGRLQTLGAPTHAGAEAARGAA